MSAVVAGVLGIMLGVAVGVVIASVIVWYVMAQRIVSLAAALRRSICLTNSALELRRRRVLGQDKPEPKGIDWSVLGV